MIIVSGLPRSGTSMMMQILKASGLHIISDNIRQADAHNLNGYYEVEKIGQKINEFEEQEGCIKLLSPFLKKLKKNHIIIFMNRNLREVFASMKAMVGRDIDQAAMTLHLKSITKFLRNSKHNTFFVDYNDVIRDPKIGLLSLADIINIEAAVQVVDADLHRQRA